MGAKTCSPEVERASNGERQILFVGGEPGIGKTAVVDAFMREIEQMGSWRLTHGQCVEHYGESEPYQPLLDALSRLCRHTAVDSFVPILRRYAPSWLAQLPALQTPSEIRLLTRQTSGVTSERMQRELMNALERMASDTPIVLWLEDVHWSDLATLDWMAAFAARTEGARLLLIATYRTADVRAGRHPLPAVVDDLRVKARCEEIALTGLTQADVCAYLTARFSADAGALDHIGVLVHRHTDGTPLVVVNVLRDPVVRGVLRESDGRWIADPDVDAASFGVPEDVRRAITRQVERLNPAERAMLETMSVLGRTGAAAAIAAGGDGATTEVEATLGELARERWFLRERPPTEWPDGTVSASFEFLHALYREVLESRVRPARRVELHRKIGERLEKAGGAPGNCRGHAVHFEQARDVSRAVTHLQRAAERAGPQRLSRSQSNSSAEPSHSAECPRRPNGLRARSNLHIALGGLLMAVRGWGFDEIETLLSCARCVGDSPRPSRRSGALAVSVGPGDGPGARDLATLPAGAIWVPDCASGVPQLGDLFLLAILLKLCACVEGARSPSSARGVYPRNRRRRQDFRRCAVLLGRSESDVQRSGRRWRQLEHPFTRCRLFCVAGTTEGARRRSLGLNGAATREHGFRLFLAWASILQGWSLVPIGRSDEGLTLLRDALQTADAGSRCFMTYFHGVFAEACLSCGRHDEGRRSADEGLQLAEVGDERFYESELYRLRGACRLAAGGTQAARAAEADFRRAIAVAASQGAQLLGLRAIASLDRLEAQRFA